MNGLTQSAVTKILALKDPEHLTELRLHEIVHEAMEAHAKPHADESANLKKLMNETNYRAIKEVADVTAQLSEKQNEVIGLRAQLDEAKEKIVTAASQLGELQERLEGVRAENERIVSESAQAHQRNDELLKERSDLKTRITELQGPNECITPPPGDAPAA